MESQDAAISFLENLLQVSIWINICQAGWNLNGLDRATGFLGNEPQLLRSFLFPDDKLVPTRTTSWVDNAYHEMLSFYLGRRFRTLLGCSTCLESGHFTP